MWIMVDDHRLPMNPGELPVMKRIRFRTLGCYPLTTAYESSARTGDEIVQELTTTKTSERAGRLIDHDQAGSMEQKKREGYF
jgi:sulfate adenylyltransferase subunit 2